MVFAIFKGVGIQHKVQVGIYVQRILKSASPYVQSDQSLSLQPEETLDPWLSIGCPCKTAQTAWM